VVDGAIVPEGVAAVGVQVKDVGYLECHLVACGAEPVADYLQRRGGEVDRGEVLIPALQ